jgi:hypothetical protein
VARIFAAKKQVKHIGLALAIQAAWRGYLARKTYDAMVKTRKKALELEKQHQEYQEKRKKLDALSKESSLATVSTDSKKLTPSPSLTGVNNQLTLPKASLSIPEGLDMVPQPTFSQELNSIPAALSEIPSEFNHEQRESFLSQNSSGGSQLSFGSSSIKTSPSLNELLQAE